MSGRPPVRRLFFALWPDETQRRALGDAFGAAVAAAGGRPVPPEHWHLTLEFLGAVVETELEALRALGPTLALPDASIVLDRLDWWRRAAVLVAAPSAPPPELAAAQSDLRARLKGRGFRVDSRPFRPHLTLARNVVAPPPPARPARVAWPITELALVESVAAPGGSRYVPLARWPRRPGAAHFSAH